MNESGQSAIEQFAEKLADLRREVGSPSFRTMDSLSDGRLPRSTAADAIKGAHLPSLLVVYLFVDACQAFARRNQIEVNDKEFDRTEWRSRWVEVKKLSQDLDERAGASDQQAAWEEDDSHVVEDEVEKLRLRADAGNGEAAAPPVTAGSVLQAGEVRLYQGGSGPALSPPRQLPHDVHPFGGRDDELDWLDKSLRRQQHGPALALIVGMPSVGKTGLAVRWSHSRRRRFPAGVLYANLNGFGVGRAAHPQRVLRDFLLAFGFPLTRLPATLEARSAMFRDVTSDQRLLVVLDNAADYEQIHPLLPASASCSVIVTSRLRLSPLIGHDGARQLTLAPLKAEAAAELLSEFIGKKRVETESWAVNRLVERAKGLPLALRAYGALAAQRPGIALSSVVKDVFGQDRLDPLNPEEGGDGGPRRSFAWSYRALSSGPAAMLRSLGLHPGPEVSTSAAAALADLDQRAGHTALGGLASASLIQEVQLGRYRVHDLVRDFAEERALDEMPNNDRREAQERVLAFYLHTANAADEVIASQRRRIPLEGILRPPQALTFDGRTEAIAWCDAELDNLVDVTERAAAIERHDIAWRLPAVLWNYFYLRKAFDEWEYMNRIALRSAEVVGDRAAQSIACNGIANSYRHQRRFAEAIPFHQRALDLQRQLYDPWAEAWLVNNFAETLRGLHRHTDALALYDEALGLARQISDTWTEGCFLTNLGEAYTELGRYNEAIASLEAALPLRRLHNHLYGEGWTLNDLGEAYYAMGHKETALDLSEKALAVRRQVGDKYGESWTLRNVGSVLTTLGNTEKAIAAFDRALVLSRASGDRWGAARSAEQLAALLLPFGQRTQAQALWEEALVVFGEVEPERASTVERNLAALRTTNDDG